MGPAPPSCIANSRIITPRVISPQSYDAILLVSFGGPESRADVIPFLENVLRGRNVPRQRLLGVAEHYYHFDGRSPINDQNRDLMSALQETLKRNGPDLPVYWGNRNWRPFLADTVTEMARDGIAHALAFVTSAYSSYSGCRQYREDIERACREAGPLAPEIEKLRAFYNHPGFIETMVANVRSSLEQFPATATRDIQLLFTAHSIPLSMAQTSSYPRQIEEASRIVAEEVGAPYWRVLWQSRSGSPEQPWLEPDIVDYLRTTPNRNVIVAPIGFLSDHMEVLYDLDVDAAQTCKERGIHMVRAATAGSHPRFVEMIRELVLERMECDHERLALGRLGPSDDFCPPGCCPAPARPVVQRISPA